MKRSPDYVTALNNALAATDYAQQQSYTQAAVKAIYNDDMVIPMYSGIS